MKVHSLDLLNAKFEKIKTGEKFDTGSITPRTTSKKVVLDKVEISEDGKIKYQEDLDGKRQQKFNELQDKDLITRQELKCLEPLIKTDFKPYKDRCKQLEVDTQSIQQQIQKLNKSASITIKEIEQFGFETIYQENIESAELLRDDAPAVLRYGLNTESKTLQNLVGSYIEKGVLHPFEQEIFVKAIQHLHSVDAAETYMKNNNNLYPNNVVLVDIFDRSSSFINEGHNQTHTIALWKKTDKEIVLIDPSKTNYSDHLCKSLQSTFNTNINSLTVLEDVIYGSGGKETGYSEYNILVPKPRDCIDIAVKVALELNEQQKFGINLEEQQNNMLKQISNQTSVAPHMNLVKDTFVRTLQSTNKQIRVAALYTLQQGLYIQPKKK